MQTPLSYAEVAARIRLRPSIRPADPSATQSIESFRRFTATIETGDLVAVRSESCGQVRFWLTGIDGLSRARGLLFTEDCPEFGDHAWLIETGRNAFCPDGQDRLVIPTMAVIRFIEEFPHGVGIDASSGRATLLSPDMASG